MALLNVIRHTYYFIQAWIKSNSESPERYVIGNKSLWVLTLSMGYVIMAIISGVFIK